MSFRISLIICVFFLGSGCSTLRSSARGPAVNVVNEIKSGNSVLQEIRPNEASSDARQFNGPHLAGLALNPQQRLLVFFPGTNATPAGYAEFGRAALDEGFDVIILDYPSSVISTTCRDSKDPACFDNFRKEVALGIDVSSIVEVSAADSLEQRLMDLLSFVTQSQSAWSHYLKDGAIDWSKVLVAGHSQGSGHAAYLAKRHSVQKVIMIAGPQDHYPLAAAAWLSDRGQTSEDRFYSLIHVEDPFGIGFQSKVFDALAGRQNANHKHIVDRPVHDPHNALAGPDFIDWWIRLLRTKTP